MQSIRTQSGFTLIEAILYVALFGLIISAGLGAAYNLIQGTDKLNNRSMTQVEAHFILHKLQYEIERVATATVPVSQELNLVDHEGATTTFAFNNASETISIIRDGGIPRLLHGEAVRVENVSFQISSGVVVDLTINDTTFNDVRYYPIQ